MNPEEELQKLGIELPKPAKPLASYVPAVLVDNYIYVSGQLPIRDGKLVYEGKIPRDLSIEDGYKAAEIAAINILAAVKDITGDLNKVIRIVKLSGYVQSSDDFTMQPKVINGASDLFVKVFGDNGKHTRAVMGVNSLPLNTPLEIDAIVQIKY
jgi:enamine deaminase RidA (YjgF/YER057c/UK114 family)